MINVAPLVQVALPEHIDGTQGRRQRWWEVLGVPEHDVYTVARELHDLHTLPRAEYVRLERVLPRQPVPAALALAAEASPVSTQLAIEGGEGATAGGGGADSSNRGGGRPNGDAAEGLSTDRPVGGSGTRETAAHTGEKRPGSDGDTGDRSEVCLFYPSLC